MRYISVLTLALGLCALMPAMSPVPLPVLKTATDFRCLDADGKRISIAALHGKVVVAQFLSTSCQHCQAFSRLLTKLQVDYGPKGFQAIGVAFNDATPEMVRDYVKNNNVGIPVGYAAREDVLRYLGISVMERLMVPQIMIVDRYGQVRAQSAAQGSPELQDETYLRRMITALL
jgi:peroxiredoxin